MVQFFEIEDSGSHHLGFSSRFLQMLIHDPGYAMDVGIELVVVDEIMRSFEI